MGLFGFGGSSTGDTSGQSTSSSSGGLDLSGYSSGSSDTYGSKMRSSSSSSDYDFSSPSSSFDPLSSGTGDVQATIQAEQQKLQLMSAIHKITDLCWDTCIDSVGSSLSGRNENCLKNCAERFVDTTLLVTNRFTQLASKMQGGR